MTAYIHHLEGCSPTPLASYLKAIGILRLVAEQVDAGARGWWQDERFFLVTSLDRQELERFFLDRYAPTPFVSPWNKASGFFHNEDPALTPLERSSAERFAAFRAGIQAGRAELAELSKADAAVRALKDSTKSRSGMSASETEAARRRKTDPEFKAQLAEANRHFAALKADLFTLPSVPHRRKHQIATPFHYPQECYCVSGPKAQPFAWPGPIGANRPRFLIHHDFKTPKGRPFGSEAKGQRNRDCTALLDSSVFSELSRTLRLIGAELNKLNSLSFFVADVIAVAVRFAVFCTHGLASLAGEAMNLLGGQHASLLQDFLLFGRQSIGHLRFVPLEGIRFATGEFLDLLADANTAPVMTAHRTEVGVDIKVFIVIRTSCVGVEAEFKMLLPVQCGTCLGQFIVTVTSPRNAQCDVRGMSGNLVGDAALLHVVFLWQTEMFFWRDIAQHAGAVPCGIGRTDTAGNVVVAGEHVCHKRAQHVERRTVAQPALKFHVEFDLIERHVAWPFDHDLHTLPPGSFCQLTKSRQFGQLSNVRGVGETTWSQTVTDTEGHIVPSHHVTDGFPVCVHQVLLTMMNHPLGQQ